MGTETRFLTSRREIFIVGTVLGANKRILGPAWQIFAAMAHGSFSRRFNGSRRALSNQGDEPGILTRSREQRAKRREGTKEQLSHEIPPRSESNSRSHAKVDAGRRKRPV